MDPITSLNGALTGALSGAGLVPLSIPSPGSGVWELGPIPIRGYALCIIAGIIAAVVVGERRWVARGGRAGDIQDLAIWAVPFGLVGGRLYHVATDWERYFSEGRNPVTALYVWNGGLGIWGAIVLGALGIYLGARIKGIKLLPVLDALAPAVLLAQAIGRWGNWFNQELYGKPTSLPWGLEIDPSNWQCLVDGRQSDGLACGQASGGPYADGTLFHPTFLYESLWSLAGVVLLLWAEKRFRLGYGRVMALYAMVYTVGRGWIEYLRVDNVQLENVAGLRFNVWTSIVVFLVALAFFVWSLRRHPGREDDILVAGGARARELEAEDDAEPTEADDSTAESGAGADPEESTRG